MAGFAELRVEDYDERSGEEPEMAIETRPEELRLLEALLFAASEPLDEKSLAKHLPAGVDLRATLKRLQQRHLNAEPKRPAARRQPIEAQHRAASE